MTNLFQRERYKKLLGVSRSNSCLVYCTALLARAWSSWVHRLVCGSSWSCFFSMLLSPARLVLSQPCFPFFLVAYVAIKSTCCWAYDWNGLYVILHAPDVRCGQTAVIVHSSTSSLRLSWLFISYPSLASFPVLIPGGSGLGMRLTQAERPKLLHKFHIIFASYLVSENKGHMFNEYPYSPHAFILLPTSFW